ncbi:MAG: hypothetical protein IKM59_06490 [Oscillospiraceae bacterium]|nr:hypothetical protein [Oscillospiraceae bacterium]
MDQREDYNFARDLMEPGEYVLWEGGPAKGTIFSAVPFSSYLTCLGVIAFSVIMRKLTMSVEEGYAYLFWYIFTAVGVYGIFIWPFQAYFTRKNSHYVITNRKIYRKRGRKIDSLPAANMPSYETSYNHNGNGTISFAKTSTPAWANGVQITTRFTLENLPDMDRALQAIARMET